jgi:hypothetical protein
MINVHLPATEDEALLWRRNTRLLLDLFLDSGDLRAKKKQKGRGGKSMSLSPFFFTKRNGKTASANAAHTLYPPPTLSLGSQSISIWE